MKTLLQKIYSEIEQDPSEQYGTVEKDKCLAVIKKYSDSDNIHTVWISKDGDRIENCSFFDTKKEAVQFQRMTKNRDVVIRATLIFEENI